MTPQDFRTLALSLPEASEGAHMGHADFRVGGRIFASLGWPDAGWGMVQVTRDERDHLIEVAPDAFAPVPGAWGERGATKVRLDRAGAPVVRSALLAAWRRRAPKRLAAAFASGRHSVFRSVQIGKTRSFLGSLEQSAIQRNRTLL